MNRHVPLALGRFIVVVMMMMAISMGRVAKAGDLPVSHVRTTNRCVEALIAEGGRRSPVFRGLVDRLNQSDVFVYADCCLLPTNLNGRLTFVTASGGWRYLRVEINCRQNLVNQIAALGHELRHAVEITDHETAVDPESVRALYETIGFAIDTRRRRFESDAAREAGTRVRRELSSRVTQVAAR